MEGDIITTAMCRWELPSNGIDGYGRFVGTVGNGIDGSSSYISLGLAVSLANIRSGEIHFGLLSGILKWIVLHVKLVNKRYPQGPNNENICSLRDLKTLNLAMQKSSVFVDFELSEAQSKTSLLHLLGCRLKVVLSFFFAHPQTLGFWVLLFMHVT